MLNSSLESQPNFVYDSTGKITGYKTKVGADTVFPFSSGGSYKITATVGFVGGNPNNNGYYPRLYGKLTFQIINGAVQSAKFEKTIHEDTSGNNMYYAYAQSPSVSIEKL